ncbi:MAG TPA: endolytic transglycosylase MltG [Vicinamibacterales bacterium]|nr:endolytic transglycosylase MltG [Vicinamibacterales bacterium]
MKRFLLLLVLLLVLGAAGAAGVLYHRAYTPYRGYSEPARIVEIAPGSGSRVIGERLVAAGVVPDRYTFETAIHLAGASRRLKAGAYRFDRPMTPLDVVDKIARGDVYVVRITFPEGLTIREMARLYEARGLGTAAAFERAASDPAPIRALDPDATSLEGYLFPETYSVQPNAPASTLVDAMVARFRQVFDPALRQDAEARGLSVRQTVTLASIVEKETGNPSERSLVAAVYENRLRIGMALQCDPTVIYALEQAGRYTGHLHHDDMSFDSPYNTYRYPGLPPGPIASPGLASINAALNPAPVTYLYFVSRHDGTHVFARTLAEHNRNVRKYQIDYFRDKRPSHAGAGRPR